MTEPSLADLVRAHDAAVARAHGRGRGVWGGADAPEPQAGQRRRFQVDRRGRLVEVTFKDDPKSIWGWEE